MDNVGIRIHVPHELGESGEVLFIDHSSIGEKRNLRIGAFLEGRK